MDMQMPPYFMTNPDWYEQTDIFKDGFPDDDRGYHLTDKAPQEAIDSYNAFYEALERGKNQPPAR